MHKYGNAVQTLLQFFSRTLNSLCLFRAVSYLFQGTIAKIMDDIIVTPEGIPLIIMSK